MSGCCPDAQCRVYQKRQCGRQLPGCPVPCLGAGDVGRVRCCTGGSACSFGPVLELPLAVLQRSRCGVTRPDRNQRVRVFRLLRTLGLGCQEPKGTSTWEVVHCSGFKGGCAAKVEPPWYF